MKKIVSLMVVICLLLNLVTITTMGTRNIKVTVDGKEVAFPDAKPFIDENNRTLIPVRFVAEELGATVKWGHVKKEVYIYYEDVYIMLKIGSNKITIENSKDKTIKDMDTKAIIKANRTYVPIRYVAEGLGATVKWDNTNDTVIIKRKGQEQQQKYKKVDDLNYPEKPISNYGKTFKSKLNNSLYPMDNVVIIKKADLPIQIDSGLVLHNISSDGKNIILIQEILTGNRKSGVLLAIKNEGFRLRNSIEYYEKNLGDNVYKTTHYISSIGDNDVKPITLDKVEYFVFSDMKNGRYIAIEKGDVLNE